MATSITIDSAPLETLSSYRYEFALETPKPGLFESRGEILGIPEFVLFVEPLESSGDISARISWGFCSDSEPLESIGNLGGGSSKFFTGTFDGFDALLGYMVKEFPAVPPRSQGEILGTLVMGVNISEPRSILETIDSIICSQFLFVPSDFDRFILNDGSFLTVPGSSGCANVSIYYEASPLESIDSIGAYVSAYRTELDSVDSILGKGIIDVIVSGELESIDSILADFHTEFSIKFLATPLYDTSSLVNSWEVKNITSGFMLQETDLIKLTKQYDLVKVSPKEVQRCR